MRLGIGDRGSAMRLTTGNGAAAASGGANGGSSSFVYHRIRSLTKSVGAML